MAFSCVMALLGNWRLGFCGVKSVLHPTTKTYIPLHLAQCRTCRTTVYMVSGVGSCRTYRHMHCMSCSIVQHMVKKNAVPSDDLARPLHVGSRRAYMQG